MNNQYMPKYVKVKQIKRPDGTVCYLEKDHINAVEDTLLYENAQIGNVTEQAGTDLLTIIRHVADGSSSTECKIASISKNGTILPINKQKNVDITVPTALSELSEDDNHKNFTNTEKTKLAELSNYDDSVVKNRLSMLENTIKNKVEKTTTIAGIDLQDNITKEELVIALEIVNPPSEATSAEVQAGTANNKMITPNRTAESVKFGLIHNADTSAGGTSLASTDQKKVQSWLGTQQLMFTFNDNTTRTFNFVCNEVL